MSETRRPTLKDSKKIWRRWAKGVRSSLELQKISRQVATHLVVWRAFQEAEHILTYLAFDSEIDLSSLLSLMNSGKTFYVTRTWETDRHLTVHRLDGGLEPHFYGYLQPAATSSKIDPQKIDLALVPGLCFDVKGTRLGYGLGYYDRLLPKLRPGVPLVGVTADALVISELPRETLDVPMTHLATEIGVIPK